jgi:hypothetical protein
MDSRCTDYCWCGSKLAISQWCLRGLLVSSTRAARSGVRAYGRAADDPARLT